MEIVGCESSGDVVNLDQYMPARCLPRGGHQHAEGPTRHPQTNSAGLAAIALLSNASPQLMDVCGCKSAEALAGTPVSRRGHEQIRILGYAIFLSSQ
jgi:hypothetical protein